MKKLLLILGMILLNLGLVFATGPDPIVDLVATDYNPVDSVILIATANDPGGSSIPWIKIYEDGSLIPVDTYDCNSFSSIMVCKVDIFHSASGIVNYNARIPNGDGYYVFSDTINVDFQGTPNNLPVLDSIGDKQINEGEVLSFVVSASDINLDPLTFDAQPLPTGASFTVDTFSWTPDFTQSGDYDITFSVDDGRGGIDTEDVTITVNNVNQGGPVWSANIVDVILSEDFGSVIHVADLSTYITDIDNDSITFSVFDENENEVDCEINGNELILNSVQDWNGATSCTIRASDGYLDADDGFSITVTAIDDVAVWSTLDDKTVTENSPDNTMVYADLKNKCIDADDAIVMTITSTHINYVLEFSGDDLIIKNLIFGYTGTEQVDLDCNGVSSNFDLTIAANTPPVLEDIDDIEIIENELVTITAVASDVDGDDLSYSIGDARFSQDENVFVWQTTYDDSGIYTFTITVSDSRGGITSGGVTVTVLNDLDKDGTPDIDEDFTVEFVDPDDEDEFYVGEEIEGEIKINNLGSDDIDVDLKIIFYDVTDDDEVEEIEIDENVDGDDSETIEFSFDLSYNLEEGHSYELRIEAEENGNEEKHYIDIDLERRNHDVKIEGLRAFQSKDHMEVMLEILNVGRRDEDDVYVELKIHGLGLTLVSERFNLEEWDESDNREFKKFMFDIPEGSEGIYTLEAIVYFSSSSDYITKDFQVSGTVEGIRKPITFIEGNIQGFDAPSAREVEKPVFELFSLGNITWGIVDFLLLVVVIYTFLWLIRSN